MKIVRNILVELDYELFDADGDRVECSADDGPLVYVHGHGEIPDGLEQALEGLEAGAELEVVLESDDAYGPYDPEALIVVPRSEFPPDAEIVPGDTIPVTLQRDEEDEEDEAAEEDDDDEPQELLMHVVEIRPDAVFLDANHPLAGQDVTFKVKVLTLRPATDEEIAEREHEHGPDCDHDH